MSAWGKLDKATFVMRRLLLRKRSLLAIAAKGRSGLPLVAPLYRAALSVFSTGQWRRKPHGRDAANEKRQRVLEHTPRYYVGRHKRGLASRPQEIRGKLVARSNSARVAASKPLRTGQGRTIGVVTVAKLFICFARVSLRVHLRAIAAKSQVSETPAAFRRP